MFGVVDKHTLISKVVAPSFKQGASLQETYDYLESLIRKQNIAGVGTGMVVDGRIINGRNIHKRLII